MPNQTITNDVNQLNSKIAHAGIPVKLVGHSGPRHIYGSFDHDFWSQLKTEFTSERGRIDKSALHSACKLAEKRLKALLKRELRAQDFWPVENINLILTNESHQMKIDIIPGG